MAINCPARAARHSYPPVQIGAATAATGGGSSLACDRLALAAPAGIAAGGRALRLGRRMSAAELAALVAFLLAAAPG